MMNSLRLKEVRAVLGFLGISLVFASCDTADKQEDVISPDGAGAAAFLEVFPPGITIGMAGDSVQLTGVVRDARGRKLDDAVVFWESLSPTVAMVTASGTVIGLDKGNAVIRGVHKSLSQTSQVVVASTPFPTRPVKLLIEPNTDTIPTVGGAVELRLNAFDDEGKLIANAPATWFSLDGSVAEVSNGRVAGRRKGLARILVTNGLLTDTALVYVQPTAPVDRITIHPRADTIFELGDVLPLRVVALDSKGNPISGETVTLSSLDASVATVNGQSEVTATSSGVARITATYGNKSDTSLIAVVPLEAATGVTISPKQATIDKVGESVTLDVTVIGNSGNPLSTKNVKWSSLDPYAVITGPGVVSGVRAGVARIMAKYGAMTDTAFVTVSPAPASVPAAVVVTPKSETITELGGQKQMVATVVDANGNPIPGKTVTWSSSDESVAPVYATGVVYGAAPGAAKITATHGSLNGEAQITVSPVAKPTKVTIQPKQDTIPQVGGTLTLAVEVMGSDGLIMTGEGATWNSLDPSIATVTGAGTPNKSTVVTGLAKGVARIVAANGLLSDTARITVAPSTGVISPAGVKITPDSATIPAVGGTVKFTGEVVDAQGLTIPSFSVVWTALDPAIASVDGVGNVKALASGLARVRGSYGTLADTAPVFVPAASTITWNVSHSPSYPTTTSTVTISATASNTSAIASISITVDGALAKKCTGGTCSHAAVFAAGTHAYTVTAIDGTGKTLNAGSGSFTVTQSWSGSGPSPTSPHWRHMRTSTIDYRIHYQPTATAAAEWDWAASHYDFVAGGKLEEYKRRNPSIHKLVYDLLWTERQLDAAPMEKWLAANGYNVENAYVHKAGTSKTPANRVTAVLWNSDRWIPNPSDPGFRAWRQYTTKQLTTANALGYRNDGIMFDEFAVSTIQKYVPATTLEFSTFTGYLGALRTLIDMHRAWVPSGFNVLNSYQYFNKPEDVQNTLAAGGVMTEFVNSPYTNNQWAIVDQLVANGAVVEFATGVSSSTKNKVRGDVTPGNYNTIAERVLMWEYGSYLMVVNPARMDAVYFETYGLTWSVPHKDTWLNAFERDIGLALAPRVAYAKGTDGAGQAYTVNMRQFENGLVLIRPQGGTLYGDQTGVNVTLPAGTWRMLLANGSLTAAVTTVKLRNSEALVFMK
jgi:hypothetical protein